MHDCFRADKHRYVPLYKRNKNQTIRACTMDIGKFVSQSTRELRFRNVMSPNF